MTMQTASDKARTGTMASKKHITKAEEKSGLWQRLRAARHFGRKTQQQIAEVAGVTRPAVALWESSIAENRTKPDPDQLIAIARLCGVSAQFLLDDSATPDDVYNYGPTGSKSAATGQSIAQSFSEPDRAKRQANAFWSAVKYAVVAANPDFDAFFDVPVRFAAHEMKAPFVKGECMILFSYVISTEHLTRDIGDLLVLERASGHPYHKSLFLWTPDGEFRTKVDPSFELLIRAFNNVDEAAKVILKM